MPLNNLIMYTTIYTLYIIMRGGQRDAVVNPSFAYRDT